MKLFATRGRFFCLYFMILFILSLLLNPAMVAIFLIGKLVPSLISFIICNY